jgi:hypothetical protein
MLIKNMFFKLWKLVDTFFQKEMVPPRPPLPNLRHFYKKNGVHSCFPPPNIPKHIKMAMAAVVAATTVLVQTSLPSSLDAPASSVHRRHTNRSNTPPSPPSPVLLPPHSYVGMYEGTRYRVGPWGSYNFISCV